MGILDFGRREERPSYEYPFESPESSKGLKEGDWIITSGYETYNEADELIFSEPLNLEE